MSAYHELQRDGRLGPVGAEMLYRAARAAARHGRFRPGEGDVWDENAVHELASDVLTAGGTRMLTSLMLRATDDPSLERLMFRAVTNHLRDRDRREGHGPLVRSLKDVVSDDSNPLFGVETPSGLAWTLPTVGMEVWSGDLRQLIRAALEVTDVSIIRWRHSARRSPVAKRSSLVRVMSGVIEEAGGPIPYTTMVEVVEHRFALTPPPLTLELDDEPAPAEPAATPADLAEASETATAIFDQLTERERRTLHFYEEGSTTVRELAEILQMSKSTTANTVGRLKAALADALAEDPNPEHVLLALGDLVDVWTTQTGMSSETDEHS